MHSDALEIRDLVLRIPGIDRHDARRLGEEVARHLADELPSWQLLRPSSAIAMRIEIAPGTPRDEMARAIAMQILRALS